jgi:tRNA(Ile)-lysidine synthase
MVAEADWPVPAASDLRVVRPLLAVRRLEVVAYLEALGIAPRFDATNELVTFHRNRVRHRVLPELRAVNPRVDEALVRFGSLARRDSEALDAWALRELGAMATMTPGCLALDRRALRALLPAVAARVLRLAAQDLGLRPDADQVETMLRLARRRGAKLSLARGAFEVFADVVVLSRAGEDDGGD